MKHIWIVEYEVTRNAWEDAHRAADTLRNLHYLKSYMPRLAMFQAVRAMLRKIKSGEVKEVPKMPEPEHEEGFKDYMTVELPWRTGQRLHNVSEDKNIPAADIIDFAFREFWKEVYAQDCKASSFFMTMASGDEKAIEAFAKEV